MKVASWILGLAALVVIFATMARMPEMLGVTPEASASPPEVEIDNFAFAPATITVATGASVRWINHDDIPHNVVSDDKRFKSKTLGTDEEFTFTFNKPGTYSYFCSIHPKMTGKVVVQ